MKLYRIGVDEVGRGPLAGPIAVCALVALSTFNQKLFHGVRDSKKLSPKKREEWLSIILKEQRKGNLNFGLSFVGHSIIDTCGITYALQLATRRSLAKLSIKPRESEVLLDGSLYAPVEFQNQKTIIKGDEKILLISLASIVAKVFRDQRMRRLAKKFPGYGFEIHKGYGTAQHIEHLRKLGPCPVHRRSFLSRFNFKEPLRP